MGMMMMTTMEHGNWLRAELGLLDARRTTRGLLLLLASAELATPLHSLHFLPPFLVQTPSLPGPSLSPPRSSSFGALRALLSPHLSRSLAHNFHVLLPTGGVLLPLPSLLSFIRSFIGNSSIASAVRSIN